MHRLAAIFALGLLAACTAPEDSLRASGEGFVYVDQSYDLYPMRTDIAEAWRLQEMQRSLAAAGSCTQDYLLENRTESAVETGPLHEYDGFGSIGGDILEVAYRGRCAR